jgi:hypothetical protein
MRLIARLPELWHIDVPAHLLLEAATVADMALAIIQHQATQTVSAELERLLGEAEADGGTGP